MKVSCKAFLKKSRILTFLSVRTQFGEPFSRWMSIYSFKPRPLCRAKHELPEKYVILWDIVSVSGRVIEEKRRISTFLHGGTQFGEPFSRLLSIYKIILIL